MNVECPNPSEVVDCFEMKGKKKHENSINERNDLSGHASGFISQLLAIVSE